MKRLLVLFLLPLSLSAGEVVDRIVAVVGTEVITLSALKRFHPPAKKDPLESLIREKLLEIEMEKSGITVTDDDLANALREVLARNRITIDQLKSELTAKGQGFEGYKEELRRQIRRMKFLGQVIYPRVRISEEEINRRLGPHPTEEERLRIRQELVESRISQELENYLDEVRRKTYVEIKK